MQITIDIPDDLAQQLAPADQDPARTALEAMAIEAYRNHRLTVTSGDSFSALRVDSIELDGFLREHQISLEYTINDYERERETGARLWQRRQSDLDDGAVLQKGRHDTAAARVDTNCN